MKLLIGIVTYNSEGTICKCLDSISDLNFCDIDHEIVIYDNNSTDSTIELVRKKYKSVEISGCLSNKGYAYGVNRIAESTDWDFLLILNPDIVIREFDITRAIEMFKSDPSLGVIGANLLDSSGQPAHSFGDLPSPDMLSYDFSGFRALYPFTKWSSFQKVTDEQSAFDVGFVTGAFMLVCRDWWNKTGTFDENFFLYFEDTDWAFRLNKLSGKAKVDPAIICVHESGSSFGNDSKADEFKLTCFFESAFEYLRKHFGEEKSTRAMRFIINRARTKSLLLRLIGKSKSDSYERQMMIIRILSELSSRK